jgi:hypothetical protein
MCSLEDRVWTLSSGKEALSSSVSPGPKWRHDTWYRSLSDIREALDELELVLDLAALLGALLLSTIARQFHCVM